MTAHRPKHVTIIGVGLLGGSAAMALKAGDPEVHIAGVGRRRKSLAAAQPGIIDSAYLEPAEPGARSDLIILATPVGTFEHHLRAIKPVLRRGAMVTDVGSTKANVVRLAERILGRGGAFIGSHPMAGSERKGVAFARGDLFEGATCVITPTRHTPASLVRRAKALWRTMGMNTVCMPPAAHDKAVARVSHLPHALASLLMMLPAADELKVAATGLRDMTRLAGGDPEMWRDIFQSNRKEILAAIAALGKDLSRLKKLLEQNDIAKVEKLLSAAKKRRDTTLAKTWQERRVAME